VGGRFLKWGGRWEYRKAFGVELGSRMIRNMFFAKSDISERKGGGTFGILLGRSMLTMVSLPRMVVSRS